MYSSCLVATSVWAARRTTRAARRGTCGVRVFGACERGRRRGRRVSSEGRRREFVVDGRAGRARRRNSAGRRLQKGAPPHHSAAARKSAALARLAGPLGVARRSSARARSAFGQKNGGPGKEREREEERTWTRAQRLAALAVCLCISMVMLCVLMRRATRGIEREREGGEGAAVCARSLSFARRQRGGQRAPKRGARRASR